MTFFLVSYRYSITKLSLFYYWVIVVLLPSYRCFITELSLFYYRKSDSNRLSDGNLSLASARISGIFDENSDFSGDFSKKWHFSEDFRFSGSIFDFWGRFFGFWGRFLGSGPDFGPFLALFLGFCICFPIYFGSEKGPKMAIKSKNRQKPGYLYLKREKRKNR